MGPTAGSPSRTLARVHCTSYSSRYSTLFTVEPVVLTEAGEYRLQDAMNNPKPVQDPLPICVGGSGLRRTIPAAAKVASRFDVPLELPFSPAGQVIQAADTYYFQVWYRDIDANSNPSANFSNMIEVQFP